MSLNHYTKRKNIDIEMDNIITKFRQFVQLLHCLRIRIAMAPDQRHTNTTNLPFKFDIYG